MHTSTPYRRGWISLLSVPMIALWATPGCSSTAAPASPADEAQMRKSFTKKGPPGPNDLPPDIQQRYKEYMQQGKPHPTAVGNPAKP